MAEFDATALEVFTQLHRAVVNILYHQAEAGRWNLWNLFSQITSAVLILVGLIATAWPWRATAFPKLERESLEAAETDRRAIFRWQLGSAFLIGVGSICILLLPFTKWAYEHEALVDQWTALRSEIERVESQLYALESDSAVPDHIRSDLVAIKEKAGELLKQEKYAANEDLLRQSWENANEIFYGDGVRTKQQAEDEFLRRKEKGLVSARAFIPNGSLEALSDRAN